MTSSSTGSLKLLFLSLGVFFSYLIYGIIQEKITKTKYGVQSEKFEYYFSLLLFQCVVNTLFAQIASHVTGDKKTDAPEKAFAFCGFTYIVAMFTSNYSLKYIDYPLQVIGKSIKPIPIMILSVLLAKRKYPFQKYIFVSMVSVGVIIFVYKEQNNTIRSTFGLGEFLLLLSLLMDGLTGGVQDYLRKYSISSYTMMFRLNLWSIVYLCIALAFSSEGFEFIHFVRRHPLIITHVLCFGLTSAIGQVFIFSLLTNYGSLMCSIVTTSRKFFTILASVIVFNHPMSNRQWFGTVLVFCGLILDQMYGKVPQTKTDADRSAKGKLKQGYRVEEVLTDAKAK